MYSYITGFYQLGVTMKIEIWPFLLDLILCTPFLLYSLGQGSTLPSIPPFPFSFFINPQNDLFPSNFARETNVDSGPL